MNNDNMSDENISKKKPPALNIFRETAELLPELEDEELGRVMKAALLYYLFDEKPKGLSKVENLAFSGLKSGIDRSAETYRKRCEQNRNAALERYKQ